MFGYYSVHHLGVVKYITKPILNFIMALLQRQMTRYHEGIKPRLTNPSFASINVGSTLGIHIPYLYQSIQKRYDSEMKPTSRGSEKSAADSYQPIGRSYSQLSSVGSNSLKSLNRYISDKEVYQKQQKNYNIISVQPKTYEDTIKLFPKYRLENEDQNYYKKLKLERELANKMQVSSNRLKNGSLVNPESTRKPMRDEVADVI